MTTRGSRPRTAAGQRGDTEWEVTWQRADVLWSLLSEHLDDKRRESIASGIYEPLLAGLIALRPKAIEAEAVGGAGLNEERARLLHAEIHAFLTSAKVNAPPTVEGVLARIGEWNAMLAAAYGDAGGRR